MSSFKPSTIVRGGPLPAFSNATAADPT